MNISIWNGSLLITKDNEKGFVAVTLMIQMVYAIERQNSAKRLN